MTVEDAVHDPAPGDVDRVGHARYPGAPPFADSELDRELFRGRAHESETVLHSILSSDLFLLYAESGLGKTSLLNASVLHELRRRGHWPVSVRLNDTTRSPTVLIREQILEAASSAPDLDVIVDPSVSGPDTDASLWDLLANIEVWRGNDLQRLVLVLDQFEELFTLGWDDAVRRRFITEFGEVTRGHREAGSADEEALPPPDVKFLLVIREDSLGSLEALSADVPSIMRNRFRLGPLDPEAAESAIREPAAVDDPRLGSPRFEYSDAAVAEILDFLRTSSTRGVTALAGGVDPSQLQIVCDYVERVIVPRKSGGAQRGAVVRVDAADLGGRAGLDRILTRFYRRTIEALPAAVQRRVRRLCEEGLINRNGRRVSLEVEAIDTEYRVRPTTLEELVDGRLLRAEPRLGSVYYELAHDTLVAAVGASRDERRARWRRRGVAALVVAVAAVFVWLAVASPFADSESPPDRLVLGVDESVTGQLASGGEELTVVADLTGAEVVELRFSSPDTSFIVDVDGNDRAVFSDAAGEAGHAAEFVVVVPASRTTDRTLRISSDGDGGAIDVSTTKMDPIPLDDERLDARIEGGGDKVVFAVDVDDDAEVIDVIPLDPMDPLVRVVGRDAPFVTDETDDVGEGGPERVVLTAPGRYLLSVEEYEGSEGGFVAWARQALTVAPGGGVRSETIDAGDEGTYIQASGEGVRAIAVTPQGEGLDVEVQLLADDERRVTNDAAGRELGFTTESDGVVLLVVNPVDDSTVDRGEITVEVSAEAVDLAPGAELTDVTGLVLVEVGNENGRLLEVVVEPQPVLDGEAAGPDVDVEVRDGRGFPTGLGVTRLAGGGRSVIVDRDDTGPFWLVATVPDGLTATVAVRELADPTVDGPAVEATGSRPFDVTVNPGELVELSAIADTATGPSIDIEVRDGSGELVASGRTVAAGDSVGVMLGCEGATGPLRVIVTAIEERDRTTDYAIRMRTNPVGRTGDDWCDPPPVSDVILGPTMLSLLTRSGSAPEPADCTVAKLLESPDEGATSLEIVLNLLTEFSSASQADDPVPVVDVIVQRLAEIARNECGVADDTLDRARDRVLAFLDDPDVANL